MAIKVTYFVHGTTTDNENGKIVAVVAHKAPQLALEVLLRGKTWERAFAQDWRKRKAWRPGWDYLLDNI